MMAVEPIVVQAGEGKLLGTATDRQLSGYSGPGYVSGFTKDGSALEVEANLPAEGYYRIVIRVASLSGKKRRNHLFVNGDSYAEFTTPAQLGFCDVAVGNVRLRAGANLLKISKAQGDIAVDTFAFTPAEKPAALEAPFTLSDPDASAGSRRLMQYFKGIYGKKIITGQHTAYAEGAELEYLLRVTGKQPAIRGFDFLSYSLNTHTDNPTPHKLEEVANNRGSVEKAIEWHNKRGGIVTFCWHWYAPFGGTDKAFYTKNTDFDIRKAITPGTTEYEAILADMDAIATQLSLLQDAGVPVLWRPLHEADGGWFWWGAHGAEPFTCLYRWMYERFTGHHRLHNLIWVWNARVPEWYPGDDVVDINGLDIYVPQGNYGPLKCQFEEALAVTGSRKPIALTENGAVPDPDKLFESHAPWLWYMSWNGGIAMDGIYTSAEHLQHVYGHADCITLDRLPDFNELAR